MPDRDLVILNVERLRHVDHTTAELLREWVGRRRASGRAVELFGADDRTARLVAAH